MARRFRRKSSKISQRQYRARRAKYEAYLERTSEESPKSFQEWNAPYRQTKFLRRQYIIYKERIEKRLASSRFGFYKPKIYDYRDFKEVYLTTRNTLVAEKEAGEIERVGSVINEMINDQAYELSSTKSRVLADYLIREKREILLQKGYLEASINEKGETEYNLVKGKNLELLIRKGEFIRKDIGLWDEIKTLYAHLRDQGKSAKKAREEIGQTYFKSPE